MLGGGLIAAGMVCYDAQIHLSYFPNEILLTFLQVNIAFGASTTLPFFCFLWAVNGEDADLGTLLPDNWLS